MQPGLTLHRRGTLTTLRNRCHAGAVRAGQAHSAGPGAIARFTFALFGRAGAFLIAIAFTGGTWRKAAIQAGLAHRRAQATFSFDGGPMPRQMSAKTWLWTGDHNGRSHNLARHGTIEITSHSATEVRGNVDFRVTEYFSDIAIGTVRGPFVANIADCSTNTGGWPI